MGRILIALVVMFWFTLSFAHDTLVSTAIPYSSGIVHLNVDDDTVTFSNGLKIFSLVFEYPSQIPELKRWNGGIALSCVSGNVVYKSDPSIVTRWRGSSKISLDRITGINCADWTQTTGNPDTIWTSAIGTPLTTIPIDSLFLRVSNTEIAQLPAKVLYSSSVPCCDVVRTTETHLLPDSNSILYVLPSSPSNPNMKLQVISVEIDSSSTEPHGGGAIGKNKNYIVSGINLRWAIDSVGNGRFDKSTSIAKNARTTVCAAGIKKSNYLKLNIVNQRTAHSTISNGNDHPGYFSLKGEKVSKCLRSGIFVKQ